MMESWSIRDIILVGGILFNAGGLVYLFMNHMKTFKAKIEEHGERLRKVETGVAWIVGKLGGTLE